MITNNAITLYHKIKGRTPTWERYVYSNVWTFGGHGASLNKGLIEGNDLSVRIPYGMNSIDISKISIGDIIVIGKIETDITNEGDITGDRYRVMSIVNNTFGGTPHVHIGAK